MKHLEDGIIRGTRQIYVLYLKVESLAVGNGGTNLSNFAVMIDLPQASSFGKRIEALIGKNLRQVTADSMIETMEEEIKVTLEESGKNYEKWKKTPFEKIKK